MSPPRSVESYSEGTNLTNRVTTSEMTSKKNNVTNNTNSTTMNSKSSENKKEKMATTIPVILRPWIYLYRLVPKFCIPWTKLDISFTVVCALALILLRLVFEKFLELIGWPVDSAPTKEVAASMTSIVHSLLLVPALGACLVTQRYVPSARMDAAPRWWQDSTTALLQLCTGYMCYDSIMSFVVDKWVTGVGPVLTTSDCMFLGHHFATTFYMTSARVMGAGHLSAMILMFTGEFTNPIQNSFFISRIALKLDCCSGPFHILHPYIEYTYALFYALFRIFIGPVCAIHLTYDLLFTKQGRENVHVALTLIWLPLCWGVIFGSIPWIEEAIDMIRDGLEVKYGPDSEF